MTTLPGRHRSFEDETSTNLALDRGADGSREAIPLLGRHPLALGALEKLEDAAALVGRVQVWHSRYGVDVQVIEARYLRVHDHVRLGAAEH